MNRIGGGIERAGFTTIFDDPVPGGTDHWGREYRWGPEVIINNEQQFYDNGSLDAGTLARDAHAELIAKPSGDLPTIDQHGNKLPYVSGLISTADRFQFYRGLLEYELFLPGRPDTQDSDGAFIAVWGQAFIPRKDQGGYGPYHILPEKDDIEWCGNEPSVVHFTTHAEPAGKLISDPQRIDLGQDLRGRWLRGASLWEPDRMLFGIDGEWLHEKETPRSWIHPMFLNINLALSDGRTGFGAAAKLSEHSAFPMILGVRNIKVHSLPKNARMVVGTRIVEPIDETADGEQICHEVEPVTSVDLTPDWLDAEGVEHAPVDQQQIIDKSVPGSDAVPVHWDMSVPMATLFAHRHTAILPANWKDGERYTLRITNGPNKGRLWALEGAMVRLPKSGIDETLAGDAWIKAAVTLLGDGPFLLVERVEFF